MRVISGIAKGRQLKGPPGAGTRPMTDRLKTSLFDTLVPYGIAGARVLDLYAGSGSLGIEMLSRGAEWCDFVEQSAAVCKVIRDNLEITKLAGMARIHQVPVARFLHSMSAVPDLPPYDIISLDPPYADQEIQSTLEAVARWPKIAPDGLIIIGHATQVILADEYAEGRISRAKHRVMGGSAFSIYEVMS